MNIFLKKGIILTSVSLMLFSCQKQDTEITPEAKAIDNMLVFENQQQLSARLKLKNETIELLPIQSSELKSSQLDFSKSYELKLIAEVNPPVYEGNTLQASHVYVKGSNAFVTYNTKGDKHLGGIELYDISDERNPKIKWQAIFPHADVSAVDYFSSKLCIVGATSPYEADYTFNSPAYLQVISLGYDFMIKGVDAIIDIPSYAGTGVRVCSRGIFAVGGSDGGLSIFNHNLKQIFYYPIADARSLDITCDDIYVLQGKPGAYNHFKMADNATFVSSTTVSGNLQDEAKSGIAASQKYVFNALNYEGVSIYNVDGTLKQKIAAPAVPEGADPDNYVSNTVTVNNDLVMIANGAEGVYIGGMDTNDADNVKLLGTMKFGEPESANYVESKDNLIFVATGKGGLKILTIKKK